MQANVIIQSVHRELQHYPGVEHEIREGGKHKRIVFHRNGMSRFLTIPRTPSDHRAKDNALRDFKKTMNELGAPRLDILPGQTKGRRTRGINATIGLNHKAVTLHIPAASKLIDRFKNPDGSAKHLWSFELRASPDLTAPPMLAVRQEKLPPGKEKAHGMVRGFMLPSTGSWRLQLARTQLPALSKLVDTISSVDVELYEATEKELVFKLPSGVIPTKFKPRPLSPAKVESLTTLEESGLLGEPPAPLPSQAFVPHPTPVPAPVMPAAMPQELTLQFPKQTVSVEMAINVLNKAKRRLGSNLKFQIGEEGYLTATHRIGH